MKSAVFALLSIVSVVGLQLQHLQQEVLQTSEGRNGLSEQWDEDTAAQQLRISSALPKFGYENLFAGWRFLGFLQYFGNSELRRAAGYGLSLDYFESIVENDPLFNDSYLFLVNTLSMYVGAPEESIRLLEKGLDHMAPDLPDRSYFIWRHKATDELLFLGDIQAAKRSHEIAADWAEKSPDEESDFVASLSHRAIQFLATDPSSKPAQIGAWSDVLLRATDDNIRQKAASKIESLGGEILVNNSGQVTVRYTRNGDDE